MVRARLGFAIGGCLILLALAGCGADDANSQDGAAPSAGTTCDTSDTPAAQNLPDDVDCDPLSAEIVVAGDGCSAFATGVAGHLACNMHTGEWDAAEVVDQQSADGLRV